MTFPLDLFDMSLLLAIASLILLTASVLLGPYNGQTNININKKKLRNVAIIFSILFLATMTLRVVNIILFP